MARRDLGVRKLKEDRRTDCDQCGDHILQFWRIVGSLINYRSPRKTKRKPLASPGIQYCPIKGPGGNACNEVNHSFQRETPRHAGEPPSSARNSLDLLKRKDIWIRRRCCVAGEAREKTICVGRDEGSRSDSDESAEVNLDVEGHGKSSKLRGISHAAPVYDQGATLYYVSFDCRQGSSEGCLLACQREAGEDRDQGYYRY